MAEEQKDAAAAEAAAAPPAQSKKKTIILIVVLVIVGLALAAGISLFVVTKMMGDVGSRVSQQLSIFIKSIGSRQL